MKPSSNELTKFLEKKYGSIDAIPEDVFVAIKTYRKSNDDTDALSDSQFELLKSIYKEYSSGNAPSQSSSEPKIPPYMAEALTLRKEAKPAPFIYTITAADGSLIDTIKLGHNADEQAVLKEIKDLGYGDDIQVQKTMTEDPKELGAYLESIGTPAELSTHAPRITRSALMDQGLGSDLAAGLGDASSYLGRGASAIATVGLTGDKTFADDFENEMGRVGAPPESGILGSIAQEIGRDPMLIPSTAFGLPIMKAASKSLVGLNQTPLAARISSNIIKPLSPVATGVGLGLGSTVGNDLMNDYALNEDKIGGGSYALSALAGGTIPGAQKLFKGATGGVANFIRTVLPDKPEGFIPFKASPTGRMDIENTLVHTPETIQQQAQRILKLERDYEADDMFAGVRPSSEVKQRQQELTNLSRLASSKAASPRVSPEMRSMLGEPRATTSFEQSHVYDQQDPNWFMNPIESQSSIRGALQNNYEQSNASLSDIVKGKLFPGSKPIKTQEYAAWEKEVADYNMGLGGEPGPAPEQKTVSVVNSLLEKGELKYSQGINRVLDATINPYMQNISYLAQPFRQELYKAQEPVREGLANVAERSLKSAAFRTPAETEAISNQVEEYLNQDQVEKDQYLQQYGPQGMLQSLANQRK